MMVVPFRHEIQRRFLSGEATTMSCIDPLVGSPVCVLEDLRDVLEGLRIES